MTTARSSYSITVCPTNGIGIMFLNEVALGEEYGISMDRPSLTAPPSGFSSVVARGRTEPGQYRLYGL